MNVPKLRFKDDDGREFPGWEVKQLGEISKFLDGRRKPIKESDRLKMKGKYPYYGASGIIDYINDYIFDEDIILLGEDGENIVSRNLPLAFKVSGKCWINNHAHVIKPNHLTNIDFLTQYLDSISYIKYNTGTAQPKLNQEVCRTIPLNLPTLPEQTKIANFLTAIDEKISQLTQKYDLLVQYKKGVMQQIFSQKMRFKGDDGREFPQWEEKQLGDLCSTFKSGLGITSEKISDSAEYPVYGGNGLRGYTNTYTHDDFFVLIGRQGALCGNINRSRGKAYISEHAIAVNANETSNTEWLAYKLDCMKLNRLSESSAQPGLSVNKLLQLRLVVPTKPEQTKIAAFLTAIDDKITHTQTQLDAVKLYKKGLLQQMFV